MKIKKLAIYLLLFTSFTLIYLLNKEKISKFNKIINDKNSVNKLNNNYNVKFLPYTEFLKIDFKKFEIKNLTNYQNKYAVNRDLYKTFFFDLFENDLILGDKKNNFLILTINSEGIENSKILHSNLSKEEELFDLKIKGKKIYISTKNKINENFFFNIFSAELNREKLLFKKILTLKDDCFKSDTGSARFDFIKKEKNEFLLFTISTIVDINDIPNSSSILPQDDNSKCGKVLSINLENLETKIFAKGFRVPAGILVIDNNYILVTDHGPYGGDEINNVVLSGNYGWPISSYGEKYNKNVFNEKLNYLKNHKSENFIEPIFSFVPSIGISQIIKIDNNFSEQWEDNFLLASLNGRSLYRIKFSENFEKIIFFEKIFIGERIRDLKYSVKNKIFFLSLEDLGSIGIIKKISEKN